MNGKHQKARDAKASRAFLRPDRARQRFLFVREANHVKKTGTKIVEMKVAASIPPKTPVPME